MASFVAAILLSLLVNVAVAVPPQIQVGINLGNVLEAPLEGQWAPPAQEYYFDDYLKAGFDTVRIPVRWDNHTGTSAPYTIDPTFLARVQQVVGWSLARNFTTIINSHHDDWLDDPQAFPSQLPRFKAIWTTISQTFRSAPPSLLFEVYNEPHVMTTQQLNQMISSIYAIVRATNPTRTFIFGGLEWMSPSWIEQNPNAIAIPGNGTDPNVMLEVHDYDPYHFTSPPISVTSWGTAADIQAVQDTMAAMSRWSTSHFDIPIYLGEFACSVEQPNNAARLLWFKTFAQAAKSYSIGHSIWDDDGWYMNYHRANRTWDQGVLQAIGL